jgi:hypothetical protein
MPATKASTSCSRARRWRQRSSGPRARASRRRQGRARRAQQAQVVWRGCRQMRRPSWCDVGEGGAAGSACSVQPSSSHVTPSARRRGCRRSFVGRETLKPRPTTAATPPPPAAALPVGAGLWQQGDHRGEAHRGGGAEAGPGAADAVERQEPHDGGWQHHLGRSTAGAGGPEAGGGGGDSWNGVGSAPAPPDKGQKLLCEGSKVSRRPRRRRAPRTPRLLGRSRPAARPAAAATTSAR